MRWRRALGWSVLLLTGCSSLPLQDPATLSLDTAQLLLVTVDNPPPAGPPVAGSTPRVYTRDYAVSAQAQRSARLLAQEYALTPVAAWPMTLLGEHCIVYAVPPGADRARIIQTLDQDPRVRSVQAMQIFRTSGGDPLAPLQYAHTSLNLPAAHRLTMGAGTRIGIIDTAVAATHPDLQPSLDAWVNVVDTGAATELAEMHGTQVAGILAAASDNQIGIRGVAPAARLVAIRGCWESEPNSGGLCSSFSLARALNQVADYRIDVLNLSLGGPADPLLARLLERLQARGIIIVSAAPGDLPPGFPSMLPGVISARMPGQPREPHSATAIIAPGVDILSTQPPARYGYASGDSLASAHVSGVVALLRSLDASLDGNRAAQILRAAMSASIPVAGAQKLAPPSLDACAALHLLQGLEPLCELAPPNPR